MGRARRIAVIGIIAVVALAVAYGGWRGYRQAQPEECYACQRAIHAHSRTVAFAKGKPRLFCCPACALTEHEQEGKPVRITELTSFLTGTRLSPEDAYIVKGSDVNMCAQSHELIDADKRPAGVQYDRCAPSMLAFARENEAVRFSREHGGTVHPFREIAAAYAK